MDYLDEITGPDSLSGGAEDMAPCGGAGEGAPQGEGRADKFRRLASQRTNNAIRQIEGIGKLSSSAYESTPEQVEKIFSALQEALDAAKAKFEKKPKGGARFEL